MHVYTCMFRYTLCVFLWFHTAYLLSSSFIDDHTVCVGMCECTDINTHNVHPHTHNIYVNI